MAFAFTGGSRARAYDVTYTVLIGFILVIVLPFALLTLVKIKSGKDPARKFVPWLKAAFSVFTIALCLLVAQGVLYTYEIHSDASWFHVIRAARHVGYLAEFLRSVSASLVMMMLLTLGPDMHHVIEGVSSTFNKALVSIAHLLNVVTIALAFAYYGLSVDFEENYIGISGVVYNQKRGAAAERVRTINQLLGATAIILWVASLVTTGLSFLFLQRRWLSLKSVPSLYLVASLLNLLSSTWNFTYAVKWLLQWDRERGQDSYVLILQTILGWWSRGALLIVAYFIAVKTRSGDGVWFHNGKNHDGSRV
ncbi:hypothetical protein LZ30DRAFT_689776 [Colletotrichum cereale]|nr:hypothetical protein LZ30DRAFT_689776 [Colletotrichum cereale]